MSNQDAFYGTAYQDVQSGSTYSYHDAGPGRQQQESRNYYVGGRGGCQPAQAPRRSVPLLGGQEPRDQGAGYYYPQSNQHQRSHCAPEFEPIDDWGVADDPTGESRYGYSYYGGSQNFASTSRRSFPNYEESSNNSYGDKSNVGGELFDDFSYYPPSRFQAICNPGPVQHPNLRGGRGGPRMIRPPPPSFYGGPFGANPFAGIRSETRKRTSIKRKIDDSNEKEETTDEISSKIEKNQPPENPQAEKGGKNGTNGEAEKILEVEVKNWVSKAEQDGNRTQQEGNKSNNHGNKSNNQGDDNIEVPKIGVSVPKDMILPDHCKLCDVRMNHPDQTRLHYEGKRHAKKENEYIRKIYQEMDIDVQRFLLEPKACAPMESKKRKISVDSNKFKYSCYFCQVSFETFEQVEVHVQSIQHLTKIQKHNRQISSGGKAAPPEVSPKNPEFYCNLCEKVMNSPDQYDAHIESRKHKNKEKTYHRTLEILNESSGESSLMYGVRGLD